MKVKELIEKLKTFDEDLPVLITDDYHNDELPIKDTRWEFDGYCKLVVGN